MGFIDSFSDFTDSDSLVGSSIDFFHAIESIDAHTLADHIVPNRTLTSIPKETIIPVSGTYVGDRFFFQTVFFFSRLGLTL